MYVASVCLAIFFCVLEIVSGILNAASFMLSIVSYHWLLPCPRAPTCPKNRAVESTSDPGADGVVGAVWAQTVTCTAVGRIPFRVNYFKA